MSNSTESSKKSASGSPPDNRPVGAILAGGASRRMGAEKALTSLGGKPLLDRVIDAIADQVSTLVITGGPAGRADHRGLAHRPDRPTGGRGPLAGLLAALDYARDIGSGSEFVLAVATDMPFLPGDLVSRLMAEGHRGLPVLPRYAGRLQPLAALWPLGLRDELAAGLDEGSIRSMKDFYKRSGFIDVGYDDAPLDPFFNVNTPDDLSLAERRIAASC